jgi:hypothetical protein
MWNITMTCSVQEESLWELQDKREDEWRYDDERGIDEDNGRGDRAPRDRLQPDTDDPFAL